MCGIAGILVRSGIDEGHIGALHVLQARLRHRGPDDSGIYVSPCRDAAFAHNRLSILDLSRAGHQPMQTADGRFTIAFNGEIYDFREQRRVLQAGADGYEFRTNCDTEVILAAFARWGKDCFTKLRGMFAFAVWDDLKKTCTVARDPLGIKPLYYYHDPRREFLMFASELKPLLATGLIPKRLQGQGLFGYFRTGSVPEPHTLIENVHCLEAGHFLRWENARLSKHRYYVAPHGPAVDCVSPEESVRVCREALDNTVRHHFVSDVPVGIFLSGGIDSTALVALSQASQKEELHTYSISLEDPQFNEGPTARRTAEHFETLHSEWMIGPELGRDLFQQFITSVDQPTTDGFNTFTVSKLAHDHGLKVVLSGLGGDELFAGYPSFSEVPKMAGWSNVARHFGAVGRGIGNFLEQQGRSSRVRRLGEFLQGEGGIASAYESYRGLFTNTEASKLTEQYTGECDTVGSRNRDSTPEQPDSLTPAELVAHLELTRYMRNQLLRDSDAMSMRWGLELRVPFVDKYLVEQLSRIPPSRRLQRGKQLLLQSVPEIPGWVANQPKRGFRFPFDRWLSGEWNELFASTLRNCPVRAESWYQRWSLFVFERWWGDIQSMTEMQSASVQSKNSYDAARCPLL